MIITFDKVKSHLIAWEKYWSVIQRIDIHNMKRNIIRSSNPTKGRNMIRNDTLQRSKMDYKHKKVLSIFCHYGSENKNYTETLYHYGNSEWLLFKTNQQVDK